MKQNSLFTLLFLAFTFTATSVNAQEAGYEFKVEIDGLVKGREVQLAVFEGLNSTILQKQNTDENGRVTFAGQNPLEHGYYYVVLPDQRFFQIMVEEDQFYSVKADSADLTVLSFEGSPENQEQQVFVKESQEISDKWRELKPLRDAEEKDSKAWQKYQDEMDALNDRAKELKKA